MKFSAEGLIAVPASLIPEKALLVLMKTLWANIKNMPLIVMAQRANIDNKTLATIFAPLSIAIFAKRAASQIAKRPVNPFTAEEIRNEENVDQISLSMMYA
jgi:hypothetical protein